MRLSSLADHAVVMMSAAARHGQDKRLSATVLSGETGVPLPTAQKLMGRLAASGLLHSARGAGGGFTLARPIDAITLADIVEAVEGPITAAPRSHGKLVVAAIHGALAAVTLATLTQDIIA